MCSCGTGGEGGGCLERNGVVIVIFVLVLCCIDNAVNFRRKSSYRDGAFVSRGGVIPHAF